MTLQDLQRLEEWLKKMDPKYGVQWMNRKTWMKKLTHKDDEEE